jgi:hypothetical protein
MSDVLDFLFTRTWWVYQPHEDWYTEPYHWFNILEGAVWLVFAALVLRRYLQHRSSRLEICYALAFAAFGLSDFREAYVVQSWLILGKGAVLASILWLRWIIITRYYPGSRTY